MFVYRLLCFLFMVCMGGGWGGRQADNGHWGEELQNASVEGEEERQHAKIIYE